MDLFDSKSIPQGVDPLYVKKRVELNEFQDDVRNLHRATTEGFVREKGHFDLHYSGVNFSSGFETEAYFCQDLETICMRGDFDTKRVLEYLRKKYNSQREELKEFTKRDFGAFDIRFNLFYATMLFGDQQDRDWIKQDDFFSDIIFSRRQTMASMFEKIHPIFYQVYEQAKLSAPIYFRDFDHRAEEVSQVVAMAQCFVDQYARENLDRVRGFSEVFGYGDFSNPVTSNRRVRASASLLFAKNYLGARFSDEVLKAYPSLSSL